MGRGLMQRRSFQGYGPTGYFSVGMIAVLKSVCVSGGGLGTRLPALIIRVPLLLVILLVLTLFGAGFALKIF
ncbi:hypothetical protein [Streptomyces sp. NPDC054794]